MRATGGIVRAISKYVLCPPISPKYKMWRSIMHLKYKDAIDRWVKDTTKTNEVVEGTISGFAGSWSEN
jgi:hypothetical protein